MRERREVRCQDPAARCIDDRVSDESMSRSAAGERGRILNLDLPSQPGCVLRLAAPESYKNGGRWRQSCRSRISQGCGRVGEEETTSLHSLGFAMGRREGLVQSRNVQHSRINSMRRAYKPSLARLAK